MMVRFLYFHKVPVIGLALIALITLFLGMMAHEAQAAPPYEIIDNPVNGGDCLFIGTWDYSSHTCTLNQDMTPVATANTFEVLSNNVTIDGAGHTIYGISNTGNGIQIWDHSDVTIKNLNFYDLYAGVNLNNNTNIVVTDCTFSNGLHGILSAGGSNGNSFYHNEFSGNTEHDIVVWDSANDFIYANDFFDSDNLFLNNGDNNIIFLNNFLDPVASHTIDTTASSTGNGYNFVGFGGNYWNWHASQSQGCINADDDLFCDAPYEYSGSVTDNQPLARRKAWFSWYDSYSPGAQNWVLMANPDYPYTFAFDTWYDLSIGGVQRMLPLLPGKREGEVPPFMAITPKYDGVIDGPVEVGYHGTPLISQRTLWAVNSLEEVMATDASELTNHYCWTWYDQQSAGYKNWVLVANPSGLSSPYVAQYSIIIGGEYMDLDSATPGLQDDDYIFPGVVKSYTFPGVIGGPVEVVSDNNVIATQRVLINGDTAFNEMPGLPASSLSSDYVWSWYDETSAGAKDWILIANPPDGPPGGLFYEIWIGGNKVCDDGVAMESIGCDLNIDAIPVSAGGIAPAGYITPRFNLQNGPVEVKTFANEGHTVTAASIATQRVTWGPSFEEVPGLPRSDIANDYHWTWYDQQSAGMTNWVVVTNPSALPLPYVAQFSIIIGGETMDLDSATPGLQDYDYVFPGSVKSYTFPGVIAGPVEVVSDNDVIATQRVLYNGFLNEVPGNVLPVP